ncbi:CocE/NonD family hydrolase [Aquisalinus flavus]|uniref:Acylase n=1 Tax=Aquisalinus flavus TaxID=1526572 RepID=A0A8J2V6S0_9PROT|nr:CocE/NonD family hydrolase [Aquisalinus flavus]MBD0426778.1 CocE/NonD family hydrolase [Aquisalinus flavus]UNE46631.1 CocE/NonD family hydrolase [Aquisalinus flavus]GGC95912.1 acylase [Aquisalinus flavus]
MKDLKTSPIMRHCLPGALTAALAAALAACASVDAPEQPSGFIAPAGTLVEEHIPVRMRDGIRLDTDIYVPDSGRTPVPTVLIRTPYASEMGRGGEGFKAQLIKAGYAVVEQHERGRYFSEGDFTMIPNPVEDGLDTFDWITAQPWSDGAIGTYGCSSSAENQLKLASLNHPAHRAMIPRSAGVGVAEAGPFREQGNFWRGGVWQQGWFNYFYEEMQQPWPKLPAGLDDDAWQRAAASFSVDNDGDAREQDFYDGIRLHLPMAEMAQAGDGAVTDFEDYIARGPVHPDWDDNRLTDEDAEAIRVPGFWAEALYDISARSTAAAFETARAANEAAGAGNQYIILTNGQHCGFGREQAETMIGDRPIGDARLDYDALSIAFFDHYLKGTGTAPDIAPVMAYMAGENAWQEFDALRDPSVLPTGENALIFTLTSGGSANTLEGDGALTRDAAQAGSDSFVYDPADPVISRGGEISGMGTDQQDGSYDQREIEAREDVLVYTSEVLREDLPVFGFAHAQLFVSSDAPDTDFTVKIVDVAPDGTAWNIADTILRMRYRDGLETPVFMQDGEVYEIAPPPMLIANTFEKGHRVRVEISSSNFPSYARSLNTAADPYNSTEVAIATNTVHHGGTTPSRIILPLAGK